MTFSRSSNYFISTITLTEMMEPGTGIARWEIMDTSMTKLRVFVTTALAIRMRALPKPKQQSMQWILLTTIAVGIWWTWLNTALIGELHFWIKETKMLYCRMSTRVVAGPHCNYLCLCIQAYLFIWTDSKDPKETSDFLSSWWGRRCDGSWASFGGGSVWQWQHLLRRLRCIGSWTSTEGEDMWQQELMQY